MDLSTQTCLVFKNKVVIRPHATEEIKILFIPTNSGIFRCTFSVASWSFSADADTIAQAEALGSRVTLTAIAETPVIEVGIHEPHSPAFATGRAWRQACQKFQAKS